jgi:hypothetical protein
MDKVDDVSYEVEDVDNVDHLDLSITRRHAKKKNLCKLYSLCRSINKDIITIDNRLTESIFITVRKRKTLGARSRRNIGTKGSNE